MALYRPSLLVALLPFAPELPRVACEYDKQRHDSDDENDEADHLTFAPHDRPEIAERGNETRPDTLTVSSGFTAVISGPSEPTAAQRG